MEEKTVRASKMSYEELLDSQKSIDEFLKNLSSQYDEAKKLEEEKS